MRQLPTFLLSLLIACALGANLATAQVGDMNSPPPPPVRGVSSSPFDPPPADDHTFVTNSGPGLDTGCTYRSGGPLVITIEVTRYLGPTNQDGTLANAAELVQAGLLSPYVTLIMPAYDVDFNGSPGGGGQPERDRVSFNGVNVHTLYSQNSEYLQGDNNIWRLNSFEIPVQRLKFPRARGANGLPPTSAINEVRIDIDVANSSERWCTAIDWASISFKAASPVILIHGNSSDGGFYERQGFTTGLNQRLLLWDNSISFSPNQTTIANNAAALSTRIPRIVAEFGVDSVHLVCHSKGGLDARHYLATYQPRFDSTFKVLSYTSLSTPHNGSALADLIVARNSAAVVGADHVEYVGFPTYTESLTNLADMNNGHPSLTQPSCAAFNASNIPRLPSSVSYHAVAADLDQNNNQEVDSSPREWQAMLTEDPDLDYPEWIVVPGLNAVYQTLGRVASIEVTFTRREHPRFGTIATTATLTAVPTPSFLGNDILVTIDSGLGFGTFGGSLNAFAIFGSTAGRNHASIADAGIANPTVSDWIIAAEQRSGDLR